MDENTFAKLMKLTVGEIYDECWLLRQGGFTRTELEYLVKIGCFIYIEKNLGDFMSDNRYMLTKLGKETAWNNH